MVAESDGLSRQPASPVGVPIDSADPAIDLTSAAPAVAVVRDFDDFYRSHRDEIGRALAFTLRSQTLGQEAVDEAMARAYQQWSSVGLYESPSGWVYRTGLNWARSWHRSMTRRRRREELVAKHDIDLTGTPQDLPTDLFNALGELSIDHRAVVVLRCYCDWSVRDTADSLGVSEGTVKSRTSRALEQLRGALS